MTRRSLLASLMALSLLCGGLGVASAANGTVHVAESAAGTAEVYTTEKVDTLLKDYGKKTDVEDNKNNIAALRTTTMDQGQKITENATQIANNTDAIEKKIDKEIADAKYATKTDLNAKADATALDDKADKTAVTALEGRVSGVEGKVTTLEGTVGDDSIGLVKDVADLKNQGTALNNALGSKADQSALDAAKERITTNETNITVLQKKTTGLSADGKSLTGMNNVETGALTVKGEISNGAGVTTTLTDINASMKQTDTNKADIATLQTTTNGQQTAIDGLNTKTTQISYNAAKGTTVNGVDFKAAEVDANGKGLTGVSTLNTTGAATVGGALTAAGVNAGTGAITGGSLSVTGAVNGSSVNADTLSTTGNATVGGELNATGKVSGNGLDARTGDIKGGSLSVTGAVNGSSVNAGTLNTTGDATVGGDLKVTGTITTDKMVFGDKATNNYTEIDKGHITSKNDVLAGYATKKSSSMELDHSKLEVGVTDKDSNGHLTMTADQTSIKNSDLDGKNYSEIVADKDSVRTTVKDEEDNTTSTKSSATEIRNYAKDKDGNKTNNVQTATQNKSWAKDKDGNESSIVQTGKDITNTAQSGTITNDAKDIVNNATGDMTNNVGGNLSTTVGGNEIHEVKGTKTETVEGKVTENFKNGQETNVTGNQDIHVTGKQTNTVEGGQVNNISGGQKNNILTGNQETTVTDGSIINKAENGDISNTAKNVTNEGTESVTNKVGANEVKVSQDGVDIKAEAGKKITESVGTTSRVVENDKITDNAGDSTVTTENGKGTTFGKEGSTGTTNIYEDSIKTGTINAEDTTTAKLTAGAAAGADGGRLTVDATDGVKGSYKSGEYTSKSYILKNTLKSGVDNGKKPTDADFVGSRTDHYMDGDKAKLDETVKDADGSNVTNKTSTSSNNTIADTNGNANTVVSTVDGTKFTNTGANTAIGEGTVTDTTIKGNTITTGKVTMDYAEVMKDLGVRGNANITGKTTTGSLEVTGTSTLKGDVTMGSNATVKKDLTVEGNTNLKNTKVDGTLDVTQKANFGDSVSIAKDLSVGGNATIKGDVTASSYKVGDKTYISAAGINANDQKITNVADGSISEGSKDAVNGGQLYTVKNDFEGKVNKVGANAAAMANLHPMEFDPDSKWNIAAAIGNYGSETAAALGAFYRPNDDVMVNLSTAFGTGENMVGGGVSVRLGKGGNKLSREENNALKDQVDDLTARMDALLSVLNPNMSKDFPDVPENHWAYEAVSRLAGNDIVQGYPDGEFHGERTMTRYEMAEIIYNALSRGAEAEKELVEEFKPELQAMAASEKATAEKAEG